HGLAREIILGVAKLHHPRSVPETAQIVRREPTRGAQVAGGLAAMFGHIGPLVRLDLDVCANIEDCQSPVTGISIKLCGDCGAFIAEIGSY
ncbi:MAG: hypothetical protein ACJAWZ_004085, partial [Paracoccaceae bacterium]